MDYREAAGLRVARHPGPTTTPEGAGIWVRGGIGAWILFKRNVVDPPKVADCPRAQSAWPLLSEAAVG